MVLGVKGRFTLCTGFMTLSLPPSACGGVPLDLGTIDPHTLPGYQAFGNGTVQTGQLGVVGWWDGSVLAVARVVPAAQVPRPAGQGTPDGSGTACVEPGGAGVPRFPESSRGPVIPPKYDAQQQAALAYASAQKDVAMVWYSENMNVVNAAFTGNVDAHRAAMRALDAGRLCVVQAKYQQAKLQTMAESLVRSATGSGGRALLVTGAGAGFDRIDLEVIYATKADLAALRAATIPELFVHASLVSVAADSPLAVGVG
jgi:hypothetical protein